MNRLVNYVIDSKGKVKIKHFQDDGREVVFYAQNRVAILPSDLSEDEEFALVNFEDLPFPVLFRAEDAEKIIAQKEELKKQKQKNVSKKKDSKVGEVEIEPGPIVKEVCE